ncbi:MAG TPA: hypothetical protein PLJ21_05480 [Pseudobdellovibrionaceae bacterium]|nr:hypothetical protein [Pseudobdellovibrionaceae bacterium]
MSISIQQFNTETGSSIFSFGSTNKFDVTKAEHEKAYDIPILAKDGSSMGLAKVDTGTLLGTPDGDLIQSHAYVEINGIQEYLGLIVSSESPMARSHRFFTSEIGNELKLVNVNLQCGIKK